MLDGASWMSPTSYCDCGPTAVYPTLSVPSSITDTSSALCAYTSLDPSKVITPVTTTSPPTNIPGQGGVPGCAAVVWGPDHLDCPYASGINYCNCGGTFAPPLPTTGSYINCAYTIQPTGNNCPVNTAYSQSLVSVSSASAVIEASSASVVSASAASVSSASAATAFDPTKTTTSCGATYGNGAAGATAAPRSYTNDIEEGIAFFCTPPDGTLTVIAGKPAIENFALPNTDIIYQIALEWDPRPECSSHPAPSIVPSVPKGPDYWCNQFLLDLLNGCDTGAGQDKRGGRLYTGCAIVSSLSFHPLVQSRDEKANMISQYEWSAFVPPPDFNEPVFPWTGKRELGPSRTQKPGQVRRVRLARSFTA